MLGLVFATHVVAAAIAAIVGKSRPREALLVAGVAPLITVVWLISVTGRVLDGEVISLNQEWVPALGLHLELRVDSFALMMGWLVAGIGTLIFAYAYAYFDTGKGRLGALASTLVLFAVSMLGVVFANDAFTLFLFWEMTSVTSFLLIAFKHSDEAARASALQALVVTAGGGLALLAGLILISLEAGTTRLSDWFENPPTGTTVTVGIALVIIGAATKSAQFPFQFWLPGAMAAPTPVSGYLHSATMVKAGVYLIARFAPAFSDVSVWRPMVLGMGTASMLLGGAVALRRTDLKQILAYGTISQLGFLMILFGSGDQSVLGAGVAMLLAHALFKAALFMVAGIVDHNCGTRDIRRLKGMASVLPVTAAIAAIAGASMAGIPLLFGFISKEGALTGLGEANFGGSTLMLIVVVVGSMLTGAYTLRLWFGAFGNTGCDEPRPTDSSLVEPSDVHRPSVGFVLPAAVLAGITVVFGIVPGLAQNLVESATLALDPQAHVEHLALWHGFTPELAMSVAIVAVAIALFMLRGTLRSIVPAFPAAIRGERVFGQLISGTVHLSEKVAQLVQPGSLPHYLAVIAGTVVLLPGTALLFGGFQWPEADQVVLFENPIELVVALFIAVAAIVATRLRNRLATVLTVSVVGSAVGVMFIIAGGPDLALTQLLVETIALVALVLVLRHLPDRYSAVRIGGFAGMSRRLGLAVLSVGVSAVICGLAVSALAERKATPLGLEALARSKPDGGGRNVVNVILVDFRGLDTMGEITVLAIAAIGSLSLVGVGVGKRRTLGSIEDPMMFGPEFPPEPVSAESEEAT